MEFKLTVIIIDGSYDIENTHLLLYSLLVVVTIGGSFYILKALTVYCIKQVVIIDFFILESLTVDAMSIKFK